MEDTAKVITYKQAVSFEHAKRGAYADLNYNPAFRSSAIFFALCDGHVNTHVSFMNYWREKNQNRSVSALVTLRDGEGKKVHRDFISLEDTVYQFDVRQMLSRPESFIGSLEIELFSNQDLKFPFPAVDVFYESPDGISLVHTNQRVFNNFEDNDRNAGLNSCQTAFDIYANDEYTGFLTLVNGPRLVKDSKAALEVFNSDGEVMKTTLSLGDLPPYASRLIYLKDVPSVPQFLKGGVGFCKVTFDAFGVFTRVACGNTDRDHARFAVTHSYFDCSHHADYYEKAELSPNEHFCFLPFNLVEGLDVDVVFYPIYCPSTLLFSLDCYSRDGSLRGRVENFASLDSAGTRMLRMDIRRLLRERGIPTEEGLYCLHADSADSRIPARLTCGLNYRTDGLGSNINSSVHMNKAYATRNRFYTWGPAMARESDSNLVLLTCFSKVKGTREEAEVHLSLYSRSGSILRRTFATRNNTALSLRLDRLVAESGYKPDANEVLWYTVESSCPNFLCNHLHLSRSGFVGGDHSF